MRYIGEQFINSEVLPDIERSIQELQDLLRNEIVMGFMADDERRTLRNAEFFMGAMFRTYKRLAADAIRALELLDAAGVWTGADDLIADRVNSLIRDGIQGAPKSGSESS